MRALPLVISLLTLLPLTAHAQQNTCEYASDNECDETRYSGTGACTDGTDALDCEILALGAGDNSCEWANDTECDEPRYAGVSNACRDGTDTNDCQGVTLQVDLAQALMDMVPQDIRARLGQDSCEYANDLECDDAAFGGTGYCDAGTDAADCLAMSIGGDDSCEWANDRECDEPNIGGGYCASGSDATDCATVAFLRNRDDSCDTAFNNQCDEPGSGTGLCAALSDTADCEGRGRPAAAGNHYFGRDDRMIVDATVMPWRAIGLLTMPGGTCTGTLVGPRLVLTAAHCVTDDGKNVIPPLTFHAGLNHGINAGKAMVVSASFSPNYTPETFAPGGGNGNDWGLVVLDRDLGLTVGTLEVHLLDASDLSEIGGSGLLVNQAGYSWDTGENLSGNVGCRVTEAFEDDSLLHECDTTQGDSGSPLMVRRGNDWEIIGVDSQFFDPESKNSAFASGNMATDSRSFYAAVQRAMGE